MPKIDTYPLATPAPNDLLLGSDVSVADKTANFLVSSLASSLSHASLLNLASGDPHPQYLNQARGDALYAPLAVPWASLTGVPLTFAPAAHTQAWGTITGTPTTLAGYSIADAYTKAEADSLFWPLSTDVGTQAELDAHIALTTTSHGGIVASSDARLTDARVPLAHNQAWSTITATPTTIAGYSISDAFTQAAADLLYRPIAYVPAWSEITSKPTTISAFGITDAYTKTEQDSRYWALSTDLATQAELDTHAALVSVHGLSNSGGYTLTIPATGTAALLGTANLFTVAQGIRVAASSAAAGLFVPWVTGDALPALKAGSDAAGNNQYGVRAQSNSSFGLYAESVSSVGAYATSQTGVPLLAELSTQASLSTVGTVLQLRNNNASAALAGFGAAIALLAKSDTTTNRSLVSVVGLWTDPTDATRTSALTLWTSNSGTLAERMRITGAGAVLHRTTSASAAAIYAPWISGDALATIIAGSANASNDQVAIQGQSYSNIGVYGLSSVAPGVRGFTLHNTAGAVEAIISGTATNSAEVGLLIKARTSGTPANSLGASILFNIQSSTTIDQQSGQIASVWTDVTHATRTAALTFWTVNSAASLAEVMRLTGAGAALHRSTDATQAAGIYAPWISGDALPTLLAGASTSGNNQTAVRGLSNSAVGIYGSSVSNTGIRGDTATTTVAAAYFANTASNTSNAAPIVQLSTRSSAAANGLGGSVQWLLRDSTTTDVLAAQVIGLWTDVTHATYTSALTFQTAQAGTLAERGRVDGGAGADSTGLMLWDVNSLTMKRVLVGAADSGGSGYRLLRIAN